MKYILCKPYNKKCMSGDISLLKGANITNTENILYHNNKPLCYTTSQDAYDYFALNDDGKGNERFKLTHDIIAHIKELVEEDNAAYEQAMLGHEEDEDYKPEIEWKSVAYYENIREKHPEWLRDYIFTKAFYEGDIDELLQIK